MSQSIETYSPKGLAAALGVNYRLILKAIESGELECIKYSERIWKVRSQAAAKWVEMKAKKHLLTPNDT